MKKLTWLTLLLAILVIASMTACNKGTQDPETDAATTAAATEAPAGDVTEAPTDAVTEDAGNATDAATDEITDAPVAEDSEAATEASSAEDTEANDDVTSDDTSEDAETNADDENVTDEDTLEDGTTEEAYEGIVDGMVLYYEDFSSYGDIEDFGETLNALGWVYQTKADHGVYSDWSQVAGTLSIIDGKLVVKNYDPETGLVGTDGYFLMLDYDYMEPISDYGDYTLQYDVTYYDAGDYKRYFCIVTDYVGNSYNSFHFRAGGYGNNQGHLYNGSWITYDIIDPVIDLSAKLTENDPEKGTTIAKKLLGIDAPIVDNSSIDNFRNVTVTIRIQHDADVGQTVFMKTADMEEFVCVTAPHETAPGADNWWDIVGWGSLAFKVGAAVNGHMDNVIMWAGFGEMPEDTTVTYKPGV